MKIPSDIHITGSSHVANMWEKAAEDLSLDSGVYVRVNWVCRDSSTSIDRIFFKIDEHEFEGMDAARRAAMNKAFL